MTSDHIDRAAEIIYVEVFGLPDYSPDAVDDHNRHSYRGDCECNASDRADARHAAEKLDAAGLLAEVDRLQSIAAGVEELHRPVHPVFSWKTGLRFEEPCPECHGKAGVHPCGCWADEDTTYECAECAMPKGGGSRRVIPWPCPTVARLNPTEGETDG